MAKGRVLVIEDDGWISRLLAQALRAHGYEVDTAATGDEGYAKILETEPDCVVCDVSLPDHDGFWIAREVRRSNTRAATTPMLILTARDDEPSRVEAFRVGADVYMTKPFHVRDVVSQVGALVDMANRLRKRRETGSEMPEPMSEGPAFAGQLAQMSLPTVLTLLEMERQTGRLHLSSGGHTVAFLLASGGIVESTTDGKAGDHVEAIRAVLRWKAGKFAFRPVDVPRGATPPVPLGSVLLEAVRLDDEAARGPGPRSSAPPPSRMRSTPPGRSSPPAPKSVPPAKKS